MSIALHDIIGTLGVMLIVGAYFSVQIGKLPTETLLYSVLNGIGAALVLISLWFEFNFSAFLVEFFWLLISFVGLARYISNTKQAGSG